MLQVPKYAIDELFPEDGLVVNGTQFIEYPDEQTKIEIPYKDEDNKAWINVEAYNICVEEDRQANRESAENLGFLPEQQDNETETAYYEELQKSIMADSMDTCIEWNGRYAETYDIPN